MAGKGPPPKPAHLRQRTNKKAGATTLLAAAAGSVPELPNPDGRVWHELTLKAWARAWASEMASQWLDADEDVLGRLGILWDDFYKGPSPKLLAEIRLQEQRFGLSPLDRSRLQWESGRAEQSERKRPMVPRKTGTGDPRLVLMPTVKP